MDDSKPDWEGSKIGQNCRWIVLKNCRHGGGGCQKSGKIADVVWTFIPILKLDVIYSHFLGKLEPVWNIKNRRNSSDIIYVRSLTKNVHV